MHDWKPCDPPGLSTTIGRFVQVAPFSVDDDAEELFSAIGGSRNDDLWGFIPFGPFESADQQAAVLHAMAESLGWQTLIFRSSDTQAVLGMSSFMRIRPEAGSAEVGCVIFSKELKRTPAASEAMFIMARHLFEDLGYRRYEWKCDNENAASKRAAARFGFSFEGVFRQDMVSKGKNRDTAWFSMLDHEWPRIKAGFETWLSPENFDPDGRQRASLAELRESGGLRE